VAGIQLPFWPVWLAARGLGAQQIGLVLAAAIWAKLVATPLLGELCDRLGRARAMMAALAAVALAAYLALAEARGFAALLALNVVALTAQSALMPLGDALTLATVRSRGLDYGRIRLWGSVSFILAAFGSGLALDAGAGDRVLVLVAGASALLLAACVSLPQANREPAPPPRRAGAGALLRDRRFWLFVASGSLLQASHQLYYGFGTLYWRRLGFSDATIGTLWAEGVVAEIVLFWQGRRLLARCGPAGLMVLGGAAGVSRWGLMAVLPSLPWVAALQLLHAFTFGASHLGAMHQLSRTVPQNAAASAQALYAALSAGLGSGAVMLLAAALYARYGGHAYLAMAALSLLGLIGASRLSRGAPP
jgi:MFS transporter, PPP family, 3-phenylpropionic acid transporter